MTWRKLMAMLFAALLFMGACSSSDDSSDDKSSDKSEDTSDDNSSDDTSSDDTSSDDTSSNDLSGGLGNLGDCFEFAAAYATVFVGGLSAVDENAAADLESQLEDLQASVPDEIKDDFEVVTEAYTEFFDAMANEGFASDAVTEASDNLDSDEVTEAQDNIDAYLEANCG